MDNPKEPLPLTAQMLAILERFRARGDLPTHAVVPPGPDLRALQERFPGGEAAGVKIIVSEHVPPGTAYLISAPKDAPPPPDIPDWWRYTAIRPENIVKITSIT